MRTIFVDVSCMYELPKLHNCVKAPVAF